MKKILLKVSVALLILILFSCDLLTESDAENEVTVYFTGVEIQPLDIEQINDTITNPFHSDTLKNQLVFEVNATYELRDGTWEDFVRRNDSENDQPLPKVTNDVIWGKCSFKFNKDIESDGIVIKGNSDLLKYSELDGKLSFANTISPFATHNIRMDKEHFQIEKGMYQIYASWENVEGKIFYNIIYVFIDLQI